MKRNYSMPKMSIAEINSRLNRLKARNKPRLQFPNRIESKKHYFEYQCDHIILGQQESQKTPFKNSRRNNLDISDIDGARPKVIQKQRNVMNYYHNIHEEYNPFVPMESKILRAASEPKLTQNSKKRKQTDSLDLFQRQIQKKLIVNPQSKLPPLKTSQYKRQVTQPVIALRQSNILSKKLITESRSPIINNYSKIPFHENDKKFERKGLYINPTFLSNFVLI